MKNWINSSFVFITLLLITSACDDKSQSLSEEHINPIGLRQISTNIGGAEVYDLFIEMLEENEDIQVIAKIDHSQNAESVEMTLPLTRVILFGNPNLGTPLMQESMTTGLDLPQKILITEEVDGSVTIAYNDISYLASRHGLKDTTALSNVANALQGLVQNITEIDNYPEINDQVTLSRDQGLVIVESKNDFIGTYQSVKNIIENNEKLSLIAELDHKSNAAAVDLELSNSKLLVFGNPELGSPLMTKKQSIGIDLPQKILVFEEGGKVKVAYNDPKFLTSRFNIEDKSDISTKISHALNNIAQEATRALSSLN